MYEYAQRILCQAQNVLFNKTGIIKTYKYYVKDPILIKLHGPTGDAIIKDLDLSEKTFLITGGTSGIGSEIVRCLSTRKCNILMACRNPYAAYLASKSTWNNPSNLATYTTDFASLSSVKAATDKIIEDYDTINTVILNAAVFGLPWSLTEDGLETIFQVNFLSQFYLLMNIEKILAPDARVVIVSSESHRSVKWTLEEALNPREDMISLPEENYTSIKAYNISKLCWILTMHYLAQRWHETDISVFCTHPGSFVKTNLCTNWWVWEALYTLMVPFSKSIQQAASTPLFCATSPMLDGYTDLYFKDCRAVPESELASDKHLAFKMGELSQYILSQRIKFLETFQRPEAEDVIKEKTESKDISPDEKRELERESVLS